MDSDEETDIQGSTLTSFLFGNIDEDGHLENDVLDEVGCLLQLLAVDCGLNLTRCTCIFRIRIFAVVNKLE